MYVADKSKNMILSFKFLHNFREKQGMDEKIDKQKRLFALKLGGAF